MIVLLIPASASAASVNSYIYTQTGPVSGNAAFDSFYPSVMPEVYSYSTSILAADVGVSSFYKINGIFTTDDAIYIANGQSIIITDLDFNRKAVITGYESADGYKQLPELNDLYVTESGEIYACSASAGMLFHFNADYTIKREMGRPEGLILNENIAWSPLKVSVDSVNRVYVIGNNIYEGIVELDAEGKFSRYFGTEKVKYSPIQLFWRTLQTQAQRARTSMWLPVNYNSMSIDKDDFIYSTIAGEFEFNPIRKLNAKGENILRPSSNQVYPHGDIWVSNSDNADSRGATMLTAIDNTEYGAFFVMDANRNRIFAYDENSVLMFALGDKGNVEGRLINPIDFKLSGDRILIVDRGNMSIEVYEPTEYGNLILSATKLLHNGDYNEAAEIYYKLIDINPELQYAYANIGKALYRQGDYESAMEYFKMGQDYKNYSMAFNKVRQSAIADNFILILIIVVGVPVLITIIKRFVRGEPNANKSKT